MKYKSINVCLNDIAGNEAVLAAAAKLGAVFDAHVTGVYIIPAPQFYPSGGVDLVPIVIDTLSIFFKERTEQVKEAFEAAMARENVSHAFLEIDSVSSSISRDMIAASETVDLVVCKHVNEKTSEGVESDFVENLVTSIGRPVLILPNNNTKPLQFDEIIVGWNGSKEAARAVFDALPILKLAKQVYLTVVDPQKIEDMRGKIAAVDIAESLARHGIKVVADSYPTNAEEAGEALIEHAKDLNAGLIVLGAYGYSRLREYILGGTTQTVLAQMDRPVLMSH